jgi:uncharacterized protein (DUF2235 family)
MTDPLYIIGRRRQIRWVPPSQLPHGSFDPWREPPVPPPAPMAGKAIIVCCDGTGNHPKQMEGDLPAATNVYLLYQALSEDTQFGTRQIAWYDPGVGTGTSRASQKGNVLTRLIRKLVNVLPDTVTEYTDKVFRLLESATGAWIDENIEQGYREIARNYEVGDRIFIFGFSRGAYTARCIAGMISRCGLLRPENLRFTPEAMAIYRRRKTGARRMLLSNRYIHPPSQVKIHVLGLWDTVASLGLPLWGWWFRVGQFWRNKNLDTNPADICEHVYHAMSMDERRSQFFPTVTTPGRSSAQRFRQYWMRGAHADVGGGYGNRSLGDIGLEWMLQIAWHHGLRIRRDLQHIAFHPLHRVPVCPNADPMGKMHDELKSVPHWNIFGSWPRWAPIYRPYWTDRFQRACAIQFGAPHDLVYRRAERAAALWAQRSSSRQAPPYLDLHMVRDGLKFLNVGESVRIRVAANQVWNRTGIVLESAGLYSISYLDGEWHDAEKPACGPRGQSPKGIDFIRRLFFARKRVIDQDWLALIGHVACPRHWPVAEFGFFTLMRLLFIREPRPLTNSLIKIGQHLGGPNDNVYLLNLSHNGLFYAFGNDAWATYPNNSGAVDLKITRMADVPRDSAGDPPPTFYVMTPRGEVMPARDVQQPQLFELIERRSHKIEAYQNSPHFAQWPDMTDVAEESDDAALDVGDGKAAAVFPERALAFPDAIEDHDWSKPGKDIDEEIGILDIDTEIETILAEMEPVDVRQLHRAANMQLEDEADDRAKESRDEDVEQSYKVVRDVEKKRTPWSSDWGRNEV